MPVNSKNIRQNYRNTVFLFLKSALLAVFAFLFTLPASAQQEKKIIQYFVETQPGESFDLKEKRIVFREVLVDSRCPSDVTCVWAGEAKILVEIFENEKSLGKEIISLRANPNSFKNSLANFFDQELDIEFLSLLPYPKTSRKIKASDYQLKLKVTERLEN